MNLIQKLLPKKKKEEKKEEEYTCELEKQLTRKNIPFDIDVSEEKIRVDYSDAFDHVIFSLFQTEDSWIFYPVNDPDHRKTLTTEEAISLLEQEWKFDSKMKDFLDDEDFVFLFQANNFFKNLTSPNGVQEKWSFVPDGIKVIYSLGREPTEDHYLTGIQVRKNPELTIQSLPSGTVVEPNAAFIKVLQKIYQEAPLLFTSGNLNMKENPFTDLAKSFLITLATVNRLNEIPGLDAKIIDLGKSNLLFLVFPNGSALEYMIPTEQTPKGKVLILDYDEENKAEDNREYPMVCRVLKLPEMIRDKPNEERIPEREFSRKVWN